MTRWPVYVHYRLSGESMTRQAKVKVLLAIGLSLLLCIAVFYLVTASRKVSPEKRPPLSASVRKLDPQLGRPEEAGAPSRRRRAPEREGASTERKSAIHKKRARKRPRELLAVDRNLTLFETIEEIVAAFGYPEDLPLTNDEKEAVLSVVEEYKRQFEKIEELELRVAQEIIKEKIKEGNYYDADVYEELQKDWEWRTSTKVITNTRVDGETFAVVVFRREIEKRQKELEIEKEALFEDTQAQIDAILSRAMESRTPNPR